MMTNDAKKKEWWEIAMWIPLFPVCLLIGTVATAMAACLGLIALGVFYVGPVVGNLIYLPVMLLMDCLGFSPAAQEKVHETILWTVCPACGFLVLTAIR
jgi:hypothetical protein